MMFREDVQRRSLEDDPGLSSLIIDPSSRAYALGSMNHEREDLGIASSREKTFPGMQQMFLQERMPGLFDRLLSLTGGQLQETFSRDLTSFLSFFSLKCPSSGLHFFSF